MSWLAFVERGLALFVSIGEIITAKVKQPKDKASGNKFLSSKKKKQNRKYPNLILKEIHANKPTK